MQRRAILLYPFAGLACGPGLDGPATAATIGVTPSSASDPQSTAAQAPSRGVSHRTLAFPGDFGAHPDTRTEWWYVTGELSKTAEPARAAFGFQVTFFRSRTTVPADHPSRFAAQQLVFAHAALSDLNAGKLRHDQRVARAGFGIAETAVDDTHIRLRDWSLDRSGPVPASRYHTRLTSDSGGFALDLQLQCTQPVLLQGSNGLSRKGPAPGQASHYYSQPQLAVSGQLTLDGRALPVQGRAWLDHEWSDTLLAPEAVGWDWIGMNLDDGSALTAFRLRRADGNSLYAGGSFRTAKGGLRSFGPDEVDFTPGRRWSSPHSQAIYPVEWTVMTPAGRFRVDARFDDQELDSRRSTGAVYWEGLSRLSEDSGREVGRGYLEMTGYAARLQL